MTAASPWNLLTAISRTASGERPARTHAPRTRSVIASSRPRTASSRPAWGIAELMACSPSGRRIAGAVLGVLALPDAEVLPGGVEQHGHHHGLRRQRPGEPLRREHVASGGRPDEKPLLRDQPLHRGPAVVAADQLDPVDELLAQVRRDLARAEPHHVVRVMLEGQAVALGVEGRGAVHLDRGGHYVRVLLLEDVRDAGERAAGADRADEVVRNDVAGTQFRDDLLAAGAPRLPVQVVGRLVEKMAARMLLDVPAGGVLALQQEAVLRGLDDRAAEGRDLLAPLLG